MSMKGEVKRSQRDKNKLRHKTENTGKVKQVSQCLRKEKQVAILDLQPFIITERFRGFSFGWKLHECDIWKSVQRNVRLTILGHLPGKQSFC